MPSYYSWVPIILLCHILSFLTYFLFNIRATCGARQTVLEEWGQNPPCARAGGELSSRFSSCRARLLYTLVTLVCSYRSKRSSIVDTFRPIPTSLQGNRWTTKSGGKHSLTQASSTPLRWKACPASAHTGVELMDLVIVHCPHYQQM